MAKAIAKRLAITYLDTGAMYRAITYHCLQGHVDLRVEAEVVKALESFKLQLNQHQVIVNGQDVSMAIRTETISQNVSIIASYGPVREAMVALQREIAAGQPIVMDGRDIGTVVLPDAPYKFFIVASAQERAKRRYEEQLSKGLSVSYESILKDMELRDHLDSTRAISPLKAADDAIHIDTSDLSIEGVVDRVLSYVKEV